MRDNVGISDKINVELTSCPIVVCNSCNFIIGVMNGDEINLTNKKDSNGTCQQCGKSWLFTIDGKISVKIQNGGYKKCLGIR